MVDVSAASGHNASRCVKRLTARLTQANTAVQTLLQSAQLRYTLYMFRKTKQWTAYQLQRSAHSHSMGLRLVASSWMLFLYLNMVNIPY
jgi:hypothetical protein